jgi:hypothetical protein
VSTGDTLVFRASRRKWFLMFVLQRHQHHVQQQHQAGHQLVDATRDAIRRDLLRRLHPHGGVGLNGLSQLVRHPPPGVTTCPNNTRALCQLGQDEDVFTARVQLDHQFDH